LCFTSAATAEQLQEIAVGHGVAITRIGVVAEGSGLRTTRSNIDYDYHHDGYRHFH
jgi:thiamine monophosphate kinase